MERNRDKSYVNVNFRLDSIMSMWVESCSLDDHYHWTVIIANFFTFFIALRPYYFVNVFSKTVAAVDIVQHTCIDIYEGETLPLLKRQSITALDHEKKVDTPNRFRYCWSRGDSTCYDSKSLGMSGDQSGPSTIFRWFSKNSPFFLPLEVPPSLSVSPGLIYTSKWHPCHRNRTS